MNSMSAPTIRFDDFLKVQLRIGRILEARVFDEARKPAYALSVDFGTKIFVQLKTCPTHLNQYRKSLQKGSSKNRSNLLT